LLPIQPTPFFSIIQFRIRSKALTMAPLKPGDTVWSNSKPHREGTIVNAVTDGQRHEWNVQFEGESHPQTKKSQQLLRRNPDNNDDRETPSNNAHLPVIPLPPPPPPPPPALEETDDEDDTEEQEAEEEELPDLEARLQLEDLEDPFLTSDEEEEEGPPVPPEDYIPAPPGAIVDYLGEPTEKDFNAHGEIDIEPEDVHQEK
jgi:hypothetical protein